MFGEVKVVYKGWSSRGAAGMLGWKNKKWGLVAAGSACSGKRMDLLDLN